jgi:signal transduction histidine kinase
MMSELTRNNLISRYQKLISISQDLASTLDLDILLNRIVQVAADLSDAEAASILLYDEAQGKLHFQVATNLDTPLMRGLIVPVENSIAGWIIKTRQPTIIDNVEEDERHFKKISQAIGIPTNSLLGVPLIAMDKITGVLEAINNRKGGFTLEDQEVLMTLGAQAAVAIENSRLFQQSDLISEFVHELRTPLASLRTATHLLTHPEISEEKRSQLANSIQAEAARLADMSTDFLDIAKLESGRIQFRVQSFDLEEVLNESAELMLEKAKEMGLAFEAHIPKNLPHLQGDRDKIKQAVLNLLSNAIKYNCPGGRVSLTASAAPEEIQISVRDTGAGIPEEHLEQLFRKFYRVPGTEKIASGTGLGLSIVKRLIEGHGGSISVESEVDVGSTFSIHLPRRNGST